MKALYTVIGNKITLNEAIAPEQAVYRTYGNTIKRFNSEEVYKETSIGGTDYIVYVEFDGAESGFDGASYFTGPNEGVTVTVKNEHTLTFDVNVDNNFATFAQDNFAVVVQSISNPNKKYHINLNVDTTRNNRIFING
ncbi:hypothetical protein MHB40_13240 [Lysinibacillus sp. FSL K6-0057]|uniref:hypothetical protein n=1 Tax=unclassified Lysinibacillus TaxID=2636778 RepID=UPI0031595CA8